MPSGLVVMKRFWIPSQARLAAAALGGRVGEHAARGGLEIVAVIGFSDAEADTAVGLPLHHGVAVRRTIHDLPPEAGFGVLHLERSEGHTSELQSLRHLVCRLLLEK